ncbi:hypothetical protein M8494_18810 [Serratia ureilytica]
MICYASVACWAYVGAMLRGLLRQARNVRRFNRAMAALLATSACYLLAEVFDTGRAWRPAAAEGALEVRLIGKAAFTGGRGDRQAAFNSRWPCCTRRLTR